jgi:hypothetical protein
MAFSQDDKLKFLDELMDVRRHGQLAEISLRSQGFADDAEKMHKSVMVLSAQIDVLIARMMEDWRGRVDKGIADMAACTKGLQTAVDQIRKQVAIAQTVVKALGFVDQAVATAAKVFV